MSKTSKSTAKYSKLIPELRFPKFNKDGNWKIEPLNRLYSFKITNSFSRDKLNYDNGVVKNIHYGDIHTKFSTLFDITNEEVPYIKLDVSINGIDQENYCIEGDIIFADASEDLEDVGKSLEIINLNDEKLLSGLHTFLARQIEPKLVVGFGGYLFKSTGIRNQIKREAQGAKVLGISKGRISVIDIYYPSDKKEQQKIADCLSSLDNLIEVENEKLENLKDHKKGLMQNLFPQDGEKVPMLRFPEFENDGEWGEKKLGQICSYFKGFAFQSKDYSTTGRRIIRVSDMDYDYIKKETNAIYINENKAEEYGRWSLKKDDLVITTVGSKPPVYASLVGRSIIVKQKDDNSLLNQNAVCLRANHDISQRFFNTLFKNKRYIAFIESIIRGNANQGSITLEDLFRYELRLPLPLEQQKIAECLSSLDDLITAQTEKVDQLKLHKKGLMQGLFPKIDE